MADQLLGLDYYHSAALLTDEEIMVQHTARQFVEEQFMPLVVEHYRNGTFPQAVIPQLAALGFLGSVYPEELGGAGLGPVAYGLLNQELERGDSGLRSFVSVQTSLAMYPIFAYGSDAQKQRWLPPMARGEVVGCFGLSEPDAGSNPDAMRTVARRDGDHWILSGRKMWITNGSIAQIAIIWAKDEQGTVRGFLVEPSTPGFSAEQLHGKLSLRASVTSELILDEVRVPEENRLPDATGLGAPLGCLSQARFGVAWGVIGAAMSCYEAALGYAQERRQFSRPIAGHQLTQDKLVWMLTEITKAQLLCIQLGRLKAAGNLRYQQVSLAKRNNVWMARECARMAREIFGANGIMEDYPVMRHMANLESVYTYEGTHEIHTLILGADITGISAFDS